LPYYCRLAELYVLVGYGIDGCYFFAVLAAVPALEAYRNEIEGFVFDNLMLESGKTFVKYFDGFIANAGKLTGFGIVGLLVTAMMLINTIFMSMNLIFHVEKLHLIYLRIGVYLGGWGM
jgi:membrane protein